MTGYIAIIVTILAVASAVPVDPFIRKLDDGRFQYVTDDSGTPRLSNLQESARFNPDAQNVYHLFTGSNPSHSQVLVLGNPSTVLGSNFDARKRTAVLIHGYTDDATSPINTVLVPAFLSAPEDLNVIVVDWGVGAAADYNTAVRNVVTSGESVARFITWLNSVTGASLSSYHIAGHSLGGQQAGVVGRNLAGQVAHITALDPALPGWTSNPHSFRPSDALYTEVIHTNSGEVGFLTPVGHVDFYPNGGVGMPGCGGNGCDHARAYFYFAESVSSGGFTGRKCDSYQTAIAGNCDGVETLNMGGIYPKTGRTGVFYVETNAAPPFSQG